MKKNAFFRYSHFVALVSTVTLSSVLHAQSLSINAASEHQTISGFGGMNGVGWINDLTSSQVETAFGTAPGQLGLNIMRVRIDPNSSKWNIQVPAAAQAYQMGAKLLATPWTPPAQMKTNNSLINGGKLKPEYYDDYATHLLDFAKFMAQNGAPLYTVSIQNEPDWHPDYESADWSADDFVKFLNEQGARFGSDLKVTVGESLNFSKKITDPILNSATAVKHADIIGGHLYGVTPQDYPLARTKGKEVWMTEHYTESKNDADVWPLALDVGTELHKSMVANYNAYVWWYIRRSYGLIKENGQVSKRGHVMAQYSRFIRPGFTRIAATEKPYTDVAVTAYKGKDNKLVIVAVNTGSSSRKLNVSLQNMSVGNLVKYSTSDSISMTYGGTYKLSGGATSFYVEPQSIATFVSEGTGTASSGSSSSSAAKTSSSISVASSKASSATTSSKPFSSAVASSSRASASSQAANKNTCSYKVTNDWGSGFTGTLTVKNNKAVAVNGWSLSLAFKDATKISSTWSAVLSGSNPYTFTNLDWNKTINPGASVEIGFQGTKPAGAAVAPTISGAVCN